MERVAALLDPALRGLGVRARVREARLQTALSELLGPQLAPLCQVGALRRGTLAVATAHTGLAHQLQLDSPRLVATLNERLGHPAIRRLRFVPLSTP